MDNLKSRHSKRIALVDGELHDALEKVKLLTNERITHEEEIEHLKKR